MVFFEQIESNLANRSADNFRMISMAGLWDMAELLMSALTIPIVIVFNNVFSFLVVHTAY